MVVTMQLFFFLLYYKNFLSEVKKKKDADLTTFHHIALSLYLFIENFQFYNLLKIKFTSLLRLCLHSTTFKNNFFFFFFKNLEQ